MQNNTTNQITTTTPGMQASTMNQGQQSQGTVSQGAVSQGVTNQGVAGQMAGVQQVQQQVDSLRRTLQDLMMNKQYADGEIITASAALDAQLQDYSRTLSDKKQPGLRTF